MRLPPLTRRGRVATVVALLLLLAAGAGLGVWLLYPRPPRLTLAKAQFEQLLGWQDDRVSAALPALLRSCAAWRKKPDDAPLDPKTRSADFGRAADWQGPCAALAALPPDDDGAVRRLMAEDFSPLLAANNGDSDGLFTGYFEMTLDGARHRGGSYQTPLYRRPSEAARVAHTRAEIEAGALAGQGLELCWVDDPVDAFFLEIQGSGVVRLREGGTMRVGYAGQNGKPYIPVGRLLVDRGIMPREQVTMKSIRAWMEAHPKEGAALRRDNPSYVFFRELTGPGPLGAEHVVLTAERSLAVDRRFIPLGLPIWLEAQERYTPGVVRRLVVAQDTGGAIRGPVRGDLFWGHGKKAADGAGAMNARGRYFLLLPKAVAARLGNAAD
jgi:membrane-bound lytic murein transglycosylase A